MTGRVGYAGRDHRVRFQHDKNMPSGHIPAHAFEHPTHFAGVDCRIRVPQAAVDELREYLTEDVGPRDSHLRWPGLTLELEQTVQTAWEDIGSPKISMESAWDVFRMISNVLDNY
ncbi:hypothetical protein R3P38DRAFT_2559437 [Favolaschia claudopus]|uniref:Uncharacterized protein n=1 Tax=Favolaschia claudopus TaxID=2862362 RepID=A0AAW0A6H6_9AGAR